MKRLHVHNRVSNLDASVGFYSNIFAAEPDVLQDDYAKWMLDDPRVNFVVSTRCGGDLGIEHLGIQVEDGHELREVYARMENSGQSVLEEGETTCCYAESEKSWIADPDGVVWETFLTYRNATVYGSSGPSHEAIAQPGESAGCGCC